MAHSIDWDASFEASPVSTDQVGLTPDFIREVRGGVSERIRQEHGFDLDAGTSNDQGKHLQGSARAFVTETEPDTPDTLVDDGDFFIGRLMYNPTTRRMYIYVDDTDEWVDATRNDSGQLESTATTGTAPLVVASTTVVTNLNADRLDGYHAGNGSGAVPLNNGTVNTNLNADMLEGLHGTSAATASTAMLRDSNGRSKVAAPSADDDIARMDTVRAIAADTIVDSRTGSTTLTLPTIGLGRTMMQAFSLTQGASSSTYTTTLRLPTTGTFTYLISRATSSANPSSQASAAASTTVISVTTSSTVDPTTVAGFIIYTRIA